jgi:hypothetical protein
MPGSLLFFSCFSFTHPAPPFVSVRSRDTPHFSCSINSPIVSGLGINYCAGCATPRDVFSMLSEPIRTGERRKLHQSAPYSSGDDVNTGNTPDSKDFPRGIVIDMLNHFLVNWAEASKSRLLSSTKDLVSMMRQCCHPIIWVRQEFEPDLRDAFPEMLACHMAELAAARANVAQPPGVSADARF